MYIDDITRILYNRIKKGVGQMSTSAARQRATAKYNAKAYDRLEMKVPKGEKNGILAHAEKFDGSLNKFLNRAVNETMERDNNKPAPDGAEQGESNE